MILGASPPNYSPVFPVKTTSDKSERKSDRPYSNARASWQLNVREIPSQLSLLKNFTGLGLLEGGIQTETAHHANTTVVTTFRHLLLVAWRFCLHH
jgi:hypothetical protein